MQSKKATPSVCSKSDGERCPGCKFGLGGENSTERDLFGECLGKSQDATLGEVHGCNSAAYDKSQA